jgi:hypothetical protein
LEGGAQPEFAFTIPEELAAGRYSNLLAVWHTAHEFTLDFAVTMPPEQSGEHGPQHVVPCEVVARVKVAPSVVFDLLRALNENMTRYEGSYGEIRRPGEGMGDGD